MAKRSRVAFLRCACGLALLVSAGCSATTSRSAAAGGSGYVLTERQLGRSGTLLDGMRGRVPGLLIEPRAGGCPRVSLRGSQSIRSADDAAVYVNGTRALNTCVLEQIPTREVERVEVFSVGGAGGGEFQATTGGLIVVYLVS